VDLDGTLSGQELEPLGLPLRVVKQQYSAMVATSIARILEPPGFTVRARS
jgi:hypothetical protein